MKYSACSNICYFYHKRNTLACLSEKRLLFFYSIRASWKSKVFAKDNDAYLNLNLLLEMPWFLLGLEARPPTLFKFRSTHLLLCLFFQYQSVTPPTSTHTLSVHSHFAGSLHCGTALLTFLLSFDCY